MRSFATSEDAKRSAARALLGNPIAFLGALGLPLAGLSARAIGSSVRCWLRREDGATPTLVVAAILPPVVCTLLGKPRGETERIYLLFLPMLCIALGTAARAYYGRTRRWLTVVVVPLLVVQSILVEVCFDTYW
jgi:hypothetical protein